MSRSTLTRTSPYLHRKVIALNAPGEILVTCSHERCEFQVLLPVGPQGAANVFASFNGHLADVALEDVR